METISSAGTTIIFIYHVHLHYYYNMFLFVLVIRYHLFQIKGGYNMHYQIIFSSFAGFFCLVYCNCGCHLIWFISIFSLFGKTGSYPSLL